VIQLLLLQFSRPFSVYLEERAINSSIVKMVKLTVQLLLARPIRIWKKERLFLMTEFVVRNSDEQRQRRRRRQGRENIIKMGRVSKITVSFYVAWDRNHCLLLNKTTNIRFAQYTDKFLTDWLVTYQDGLFSMESGNLVRSETKCLKGSV
jgi:hypothetical protein